MQKLSKIRPFCNFEISSAEISFSKHLSAATKKWTHVCIAFSSVKTFLDSVLAFHNIIGLFIMLHAVDCTARHVCLSLICDY